MSYDFRKESSAVLMPVIDTTTGASMEVVDFYNDGINYASNQAVEETEIPTLTDKV